MLQLVDFKFVKDDNMLHDSSNHDTNHGKYVRYNNKNRIRSNRNNYDNFSVCTNSQLAWNPGSLIRSAAKGIIAGRCPLDKLKWKGHEKGYLDIAKHGIT